MKSINLSFLLAFIALGLFFGCAKSSTPPKTIYDTVTVTKIDTLTLFPPGDTPNVTNGLVLYLPFNGSIADSSGLNNIVTAIGGATLGYDMHGYANSAFTSSGNGARLIVANNGAYQVDTAFSVSLDFMIRTPAYYNGGYPFTGLMTFLSIVDTLQGNGPTFNLGLNVPGEPQYFCFGSNPASSGCDASGDNNPDNVADTTAFIPQVGSWYNAICTFTNGTVSVYINGQLAGHKVGVAGPAEFCPSSVFVVGGWWNGDPQNINGEIDEVRFYNRTLTGPQIAWLSRNFQPNSISTKASPGVKSNNPSRF
jgi:hypothetical protein